MSKLSDEVESLIERACKNNSSIYALQFTQAALNAANALRVLAEVRDIDRTE